jgi:CheY-like chemotaxis protein
MVLAPSRGPVLIVEDNADARALLVRIMEDAGFKVVTAENGLEALEQLRRAKPCVVLLDLALPFLDGEGVADAVLRDPEFAIAPIICVSGLADARERAARLGIQDCLTKPVDPEILIAKVYQYCGR